MFVVIVTSQKEIREPIWTLQKRNLSREQLSSVSLNNLAYITQGIAHNCLKVMWATEVSLKRKSGLFSRKEYKDLNFFNELFTTLNLFIMKIYTARKKQIYSSQGLNLKIFLCYEK